MADAASELARVAQELGYLRRGHEMAVDRLTGNLNQVEYELRLQKEQVQTLQAELSRTLIEREELRTELYELRNLPVAGVDTEPVDQSDAVEVAMAGIQTIRPIRDSKGIMTRIRVLFDNGATEDFLRQTKP